MATEHLSIVPKHSGLKPLNSQTLMSPQCTADSDNGYPFFEQSALQPDLADCFLGKSNGQRTYLAIKSAKRQVSSRTEKTEFMKRAQTKPREDSGQCPLIKSCDAACLFSWCKHNRPVKLSRNCLACSWLPNLFSSKMSHSQVRGTIIPASKQTGQTWKSAATSLLMQKLDFLQSLTQVTGVVVVQPS